MIGVLRKFAEVRRDEKGSVVIETAIVLPVLVLMALGGFEASRIVSRQSELQAAIGEATAVVIAAPPEDQTEIDQVEAIIETSTGLSGNDVKLDLRYKCDSDVALVFDETSCATGAVISEFIHIRIRDTYTPIWTQFGIGSAVNYDIKRRVQIS